jgi:FKBP-type peptidyl-prolyl cis-trans isomerase
MCRKSQLNLYRVKTRTALLIAGLFLLLGACFDNDEVDFDAQLQADLAIIDQYLAAKGITPLIDPENKVRYVLHVEGTGRSPHDTTCVKATYQGKILDTEQIFTSEEKNTFRMSGDIIEGWKIALPLLQIGDSATIYVPSVLAYGTAGNPGEGIAPNENLLFHFRVHNVGKTNTTGASPTCAYMPLSYDELLTENLSLVNKIQFEKDKQSIDDSLAKWGVNDVLIDPRGGVRYTVQHLGSGVKPVLSSIISVKYKAMLLKGGGNATPFDENDNLQIALYNLILGWQTSLPLFPSGSKFTLYVPSGLAYGPTDVKNSNGDIIIPKNSNLVFEVELLSVL